MNNPSAISKSNERPLETNENKQTNKQKKVYIFILKSFLERSIFTHVYFLPISCWQTNILLCFADDINSCLKNFIVYSQKKQLEKRKPMRQIPNLML